MQGIFLNYRRPKSKKEIKEAVLSNPRSVSAEATSMFGGDFDGPIINLADGQSITFVGPDPFTSRKFYGSITRKGDVFKVS
jgi:hypothetical protein